MPKLQTSLLLVLVLAGCSAETAEDPPGVVSAFLTSQDVVLHAGTATRATVFGVVADSTAASGVRMHDPNDGTAKVGTALASPTSWFEMTFNATANTPYRLWMRMKADGDAYSNDSVHVQFSDSSDANGAAYARIGTSSSHAVVLEQCDGQGRHGWGWSDNGWCSPGPTIRFATTGVHTIRVQRREDGVSVDQIVLSPSTYLTNAPGAAKDDTTRLPAQNGTTVTPPPPPPASTMKVLTWNTSGPLSSAAIDLVTAQTPQVVFLEEVDSVQLVENLRARLQAVQGGTWQKAVYSRGTDTSSSYVAIVSKYALSNVAPLILRKPGTYVVSCYSSSPATFAGRSAVGATITVNGRAMSVFATRATSENDRGCLREEENAKLKAWANASYPAPHVYGGDFNMQPYSNEAEYQLMLNAPYPTTDSWALAVAEKTAISYDGNPTVSTPTRNTRMDYVFFDKGTTALDLKSAQIVDHKGLSDHRLMMATFTVQ
jgi:endonuclease/exonuclease/phosphatase family metal-dependent hydrolase